MMNDRMPPLAPEALSEEQRNAAAELAAGPRGGVRGPFIPLLRSPELMQRLQKVGEYLRYQSALERRLGELAMLIVSRHLTQQFEWQVHYPLAVDAGLAKETAEALAQGARPRKMREDEETVYDFCAELLHTHGVAEDTYQAAAKRLGERGLIDLVGLVGYFLTVSLVLNVAHTPASAGTAVAPLEPLPR
jgi:4-carboxymuconolactone decarboxylase